MKKVTAFVGSARKKNTYRAVLQFMNNLQALGEVEYEIVVLTDYQLGICRGCQLCVTKGEALCPLKDDRDVLLDKIKASDGVLFATPNYTWNLSGIMKVFLDRFGFIVHRPRYFGKSFTSIVTQAMGQGGKIVEYFDYAALTLGFNTLKGIVLTGFDPKTAKQQQKIDRQLAKHSQRFYRLLMQPAYPMPTMFQLVGFRMSRTIIRRLNPDSIDHKYFGDNGFYESDYYYPVRLGLLKSLAGKIFDRMAPAIQKMFA